MRKLNAPMLVIHKESGKYLRLRSISNANATLKRNGWKGLVCHVQNEKGTGLVEYGKLRALTDDEKLRVMQSMSRSLRVPLDVLSVPPAPIRGF